jgi:kynurenine formamidase
MTEIPTMDEVLKEAPKNWGKWGEEDEVGALNYLTTEEVFRGVRHIKSGTVFTLQRLIGDPKGDPVWPGRTPAEKTMILDESSWDGDGAPQFPGGLHYADDKISAFLQGSTQYDALGHVWYGGRLWNGYADGQDLAALPLESCVELPAALARTIGSGSRAVDVGALAALEVAGRAVLLHTGGDAAWGHAGYAADAPYLTEAGARWLAERGARLVGIDSVSIDDIQGGGRRPAHSILLRAGIPVVEHLTGLGQLPPTGFRFTAAPIPLAGLASFPTRAYATIPQP